MAVRVHANEKAAKRVNVDSGVSKEDEGPINAKLEAAHEGKQAHTQVVKLWLCSNAYVTLFFTLPPPILLLFDIHFFLVCVCVVE